MTSRPALREPPLINDPEQTLPFLRAGDRLAKCHKTGWRLVYANIRVSDEAASLLQRGGPLLDSFGGRLAPLGDTLLANPQLSQTWAWAVNESTAKH